MTGLTLVEGYMYRYFTVHSLESMFAEVDGLHLEVGRGWCGAEPDDVPVVEGGQMVDDVVEPADQQ